MSNPNQAGSTDLQWQDHVLLILWFVLSLSKSGSNEGEVFLGVICVGVTSQRQTMTEGRHLLLAYVSEVPFHLCPGNARIRCVDRFFFRGGVNRKCVGAGKVDIGSKCSFAMLRQGHCCHLPNISQSESKKNLGRLR